MCGLGRVSLVVSRSFAGYGGDVGVCMFVLFGQPYHGGLAG
jgi:hypothetical protein